MNKIFELLFVNLLFDHIHSILFQRTCKELYFQDDVKSAEKFLLHPSLESFTNLPHENRVELIKRSLKVRGMINIVQ